MSKKVEITKELRESRDPHYNCCQSVCMSFKDECKIDEETLYNMGTHFAAGMRVGGVCGAVSGAMMTMSMLKCSNADAKAFMEEFERKHGSTNCATLTETKDDSISRKDLCNMLIFDAVEQVEKIIKK